MEKAVQMALDHGFSQAGVLDVNTLVALPEVRDMCAAGRCQLYGKCWTCPPGCGTIEENAAEMQTYKEGVIVQTTRHLEDEFDIEGMDSCAKAHRETFIKLAPMLRKAYQEKKILTLGAGGCSLCDACTYPDAPCLRPEEALSSMEAYGLFVSDVCQKNNIGYYYGKSTMTYTSCYLFK